MTRKDGHHQLGTPDQASYSSSQYKRTSLYIDTIRIWISRTLKLELE